MDASFLRRLESREYGNQTCRSKAVRYVPRLPGLETCQPKGGDGEESRFCQTFPAAWRYDSDADWLRWWKWKPAIGALTLVIATISTGRA